MTSDRFVATIGGLAVRVSPRLEATGAKHCFTTRHGGVSSGAYASLNLGLHTGDDPELVGENRRRVCEALDCGGDALRLVRQVHGARVVDVDETGPHGDIGDTAVDADGIVSTRPGLLVGVRVADCLAVLLATVDGSAVAALHAGWRGLAEGILAVGVEKLGSAAGVPPSDIVAAIGPGIGVARYEVGNEVAERFPAEHSRIGDGRPHVDLAGIAREQLQQAGVVAIDVIGACTYEEAGEFFSHRRDNGATGRQAGLIAARAR